MAFYQTARSLPRRFRLILSSFLQADGLPFADVLPEETIEQAFEEEGCACDLAGDADQEKRVYTPAVTLWAFLSQVLFKEEERSCVAAVARVVVLLVSLGKERPSDNSGAYCRARARLPEPVIRRLTCDIASGCEKAIADCWLWRGRHVKFADGATVSMSDTEANQAEYPQQKGQKEGLGFPIARMVVLSSLATAMVCDMAIGPYTGKETGETALIRQLVERLNRGDILLADRIYCSYFLICQLLDLGVDFVVRLHQARTADFRRGQRLGKGDHVVVWTRPAKPEWMDQETYDRSPTSIEVREVQVDVDEPGFRTDSFIVVTTLLDAKTYTAADIGELYHKRWLVELDIRAIKKTLGMDVLRCKSPEMVRREIWTSLLAYNLIRKAILQAASKGGLGPRQISFTATKQKITASWESLPLLSQFDEATMVLLIEVHLEDLIGHRVGHRPGRVEPRAVKRRPKPHRLLTMPRQEARARLLNGEKLYEKHK